MREGNVLAIDPGWNGAMVFGEIGFDGEAKFAADMPRTSHAIYEAVDGLCFDAGVTCAVMEQVAHYHAGSNIPGSRMMALGENIGMLKMLFAALKIPLYEVHPKKWQKVLGLGGRGDMTRAQWKKTLFAKAKDLFPRERVTPSNADAYLIYFWAKMMVSGGRDDTQEKATGECLAGPAGAKCCDAPDHSAPGATRTRRRTSGSGKISD